MRLLPVILGCLTVATTCLAQNWKQIKPSLSPPARSAHVMAYDSARQRTVLFGGVSRSTNLRDMWEWDGKTWTQVKPTASPFGSNLFMAYDSVRQRTVMTRILNGFSTFEWDGANWTQIKTARTPAFSGRPAMVYDSARQVVVLYVDRGTWEYDGKNWTKITSPLNPGFRSLHAMAYDSSRRRTVLFGGVFLPSDTWEWDGVNWVPFQPSTSPPARMLHAMVYDSGRQRTVLIGGVGVKAMNDTWEWDGKNWTQIKPSTSPPARILHAMVYDSVRQRVVLFGGDTNNGRLGDTWEYGIAKLTLTANTSTISITNGGKQILTLNAGTDLKNKSYWIFGSATSTMPGIVLTGIHIPLLPDIYTNIVLGAVNGKEFKDFKRTLSATGTATASLNVPTNLGIPTGFKLYHAYVVYDGTTGQVFTSSNPVSVEFK